MSHQYFAHSDWIDWDNWTWEWYPKFGFGGRCYFWRSTRQELWSVIPHTQPEKQTLPFGDRYKITVHYFSGFKAYRDEAVTYVALLDEEHLPYRWLEARSHHIHIWLDSLTEAKIWLERIPNRLSGKPAILEWSDTSIFGRKLITMSDFNSKF